MDPEMDNIEDEGLDENEEAKNSEKNTSEAKDGDASKDETPPANDTAEGDKEAPKSYRPSDEEKVKVAAETVPLKKYLDVKAKLKEVRESSSTSSLDNKTLEEFAEDSGLQVDTVKKLASIIIAQAKDEATKVAEDRVKPIILEKMSRANLDAFEQDFNRSIVSKYPELANKIETFKKVAFSKDFLHLKSLEEIKNEFFPDAKQVEKEVKTASVEKGSVGGSKGSETIDFSKLKDNPEQYAKVMADPNARAKYYAWQDAPSD